ncbi:Uncharacterised protein [Vibrio cholerae]|nr:Uncharacterised protein [Vibrio cholerae]
MINIITIMQHTFFIPHGLIDDVDWNTLFERNRLGAHWKIVERNALISEQGLRKLFSVFYPNTARTERPRRVIK